MIYKDHLVSNESFEIIDYQKGVLQTYPVPQDLGRYYESEDYISHSDSKKGFQNKIYQMVKSHMLSQKTNWIQKYFKGGNILDYGAGTGDFLSQMKKSGWKVIGLEPNENARELGIRKGINIKSQLSDLGNNQYDVISLWHVLEHIPDFETKILEFKNYLKKDGILIIAVPNYNSYDAAYYKNDWAAWDVPRHLWHFSRKGLTDKIENSGFRLVQEKPLKFDSFYVSLLSEKNRAKSTNIVNAVFRGLMSNLKAKSSGEYSSIAYFFKKVE